MATFTAGTIRDYLKNLSDWILGNHEPKVKLAGDAYTIYGATADERPAASSVPVGTVFMAVRTQEMWQSDGTDWVAI